MANNIIKFTSKDYKSICADLIDAIPSLSNTWTSREDGDPGIVLVKLMSALGDMLSYNFDKQAVEYYAPTVTQRKNAAKLFELIGYTMRWYRAAQTTVTLTNLAPIEDYVYDYKQLYRLTWQSQTVYEQTLISVYTEYREKYADTANLQLSIPPREDDPLPQGFPSRQTFTIHSTVEADLNDGALIFAFYTAANNFYDKWRQDSANTIELHRNLLDYNMTLALYGQESTALAYSLVPETINVVPSLGMYGTTATDILYPYEPKKFKAIQGFLNSIRFTKTQLKNNRFYVPDSQLDDTYMYLTYTTLDSDAAQEKTIFISKTDNLLTITDFNYSESSDVGSDMDKPKIYFQFSVDDFDYPYIELSSYWEEQLGSDGITFTFYYFKTLGKNGVITTDYLQTLGVTKSNNLLVSNLSNWDYLTDEDGKIVSSPGFNPQTAANAYVDSLNYIMTYNTLVTIYDFTRFTRRQEGISNAFACDGQYADDLNRDIMKQCSSYTIEQLKSILGENASAVYSESDTDAEKKIKLVNALYNIRQIYYDYHDNNYLVSQAISPNAGESFLKYGLNLYPIVSDYLETDEINGEQNPFAEYTNIVPITDVRNVYSPYMLYRIYTKDDYEQRPERYKYATQISDAINKTRIVNTVAEYSACRVFPWRVCGTLHLTQLVTQNDAQQIINNVINYLSRVYTPANVQFGKKITYMEVIDAVLASDARIRYFDAGIGNNKLISFEVPDNITPSDCFNVEAYFNPISIMRYVQTADENSNETSPFYNMLIVDPNYIQQMRSD